MIRTSEVQRVRFEPPWSERHPYIQLNIEEEMRIDKTIYKLIAIDTTTQQNVQNYVKVEGSDPDNLFTVNQHTGMAIFLLSHFQF